VRHFFLLILLSITLVALELPKKIEYTDKPKDIVTTIMEYFVQSNYKGGLALAKKYWVLPDREIDALLRQIHRQSAIINKRFGKSLSYEFIKMQRLGRSFVRYYYLQKFENHAIYWQFTFYRPKSLWQINQINFKDDLHILFE